jgi:hypothetical protein
MIQQNKNGKLWENIFYKNLDENNGTMDLVELIKETDKQFLVVVSK